MTKHENLFIGRFPGCIVFADKAKYVNGDYKSIAHVSYSGEICWLIDDLKNVEPAVISAVERTAEEERGKWTARFNQELQHDPWRLYWRILDRLNVSDYVEWTRRDEVKRMTAEERCRALMPVYIKYG